MGVINYICFSVAHFIAFALALTVCGLYGKDIDRANKQDKYTDTKWVYAVVVGGLSVLTCLLYFVPFILRASGIFAPVWNFILFVLWIAVFGVFGSVSAHSDYEHKKCLYHRSPLTITH